MQRALAFVLMLSSGCVGNIGDSPVRPEPLQLQLVESQVALSAAAGFADERGGGVFVDGDAEPVRLRSDGSKGTLESHPGNTRAPGKAQRVLPCGPFSALVAAENGLYTAEAGWLIEPAWRDALSPTGVVSAALGSDGVAWLAHERGLFRIEGGELFELQIAGRSIAGITALAVAPAPDGANAVWFARGDGLSFAKQTARSRYEVSSGGLESDSLKGKILALAGVPGAARARGELWLISETATYRHGEDGWTRHATEAPPEQLLAAGRTIWLRVGAALYRYDVDGARWGEVKGVREPTLLAADASGSLWLTAQGKTLEVRSGPVPRLLGLFEGARVYTSDVRVRAQLPLSEGPLGVSFQLDDGAQVEQTTEQAAPGVGAVTTLDFALGGFDAAGREQTFSLAGLANGMHTLTVSARFETGVSRRELHFELHNAAAAPLSFEADVKPLLEARCAKCHANGPGHALKTYEQWLNEKDKIAAAVVELRMPADGPLNPAQIQLLQRWASGGASP